MLCKPRGYIYLHLCFVMNVGFPLNLEFNHFLIPYSRRAMQTFVVIFFLFHLCELHFAWIMWPLPDAPFAQAHWRDGVPSLYFFLMSTRFSISRWTTFSWPTCRGKGRHLLPIRFFTFKSAHWMSGEGPFPHLLNSANFRNTFSNGAPRKLWWVIREVRWTRNSDTF